MLVKLGSVGVLSLGDIDQSWQGVDVQIDQVDGILGQGGAVSDDHRDDLTDMINLTQRHSGPLGT